MNVIKFGGSSLAEGSQLEKVIAIISADTARQVVVVSAPGKRFKDDIKVTDLLASYAEQAIAGDDTVAIQAEIINRYRQIVAYFNLDETEIIGTLSEQLAKLSRVHYPSFDYLYKRRRHMACRCQPFGSNRVDQLSDQQGIVSTRLARVKMSQAFGHISLSTVAWGITFDQRCTRRSMKRS